MARNKSKKRSRSGKKFTLSLAAVAGFAPLGKAIYDDFKTGNGVSDVPYTLSAALTGYNMVDKKWHASHLMVGLVPISAGVLVHKIANKIGINRMLAQSGMPVLRV